MNMEEFSGKVLEAVKEKAEGTFNMCITIQTKNNNVTLTGIKAVRPGSNIAPVVYLDKYLDEYNDGGDFNGIAEAVYRNIVEREKHKPSINAADMLQWDKIKGRVYAKLVNAELNKEMLSEIPHRLFLDMAVVYYIYVGAAANFSTATILIHNNHMEIFGQDEESLYLRASANMRSDGEPLFEDMKTMIENIMPGATKPPDEDEAQDVRMYVLTNRRKQFGAAEILDGSTLMKIGYMLGDDYIIIPCSIHETIILPLLNSPEYSTLVSMVKEVNNTQLEEEDRLSDNIYVYIRSEGVLKIAG